MRSFGGILGLKGGYAGLRAWLCMRRDSIGDYTSDFPGGTGGEKDLISLSLP